VLGPSGLVPAAALYGALAGGTTGSGVVLISILMASGLQGSAVVATDAIISLAIGVVKTATFGLAGALGPPLVLFAALIGLATFPGGFIARAIADRLSVRVHNALLDGAVVVGAVGLLWRGLSP
jgi:uncharacterized protein